VLPADVPEVSDVHHIHDEDVTEDLHDDAVVTHPELYTSGFPVHHRATS